MGKKSIFYYILFILAGLLIVPSLIGVVGAQEEYKPPAGFPLITPYVTPRMCISNDVLPDGTCPPSSRQESFCPGLDQTDAANYPCASTYEDWLKDTTQNFWVYDPDVTALGKGGERSRQFLLWVLTHPSIDDHPVILEIWSMSRNVALFLILLVVIIMGIGIIVGQQNNFDLRIEISPLLIKVGVLILYVVFSARIVLLFIELTDILMEFFIRNLGVIDLFNIYFVSDLKRGVIENSETAYKCFVGCSNWSTNNLEMVKTSKFLVKFTNMTYYFLGIMLLLRKVVLWFLMVVAPFLALLAPFVFIRNIGWIWIGVFFQWVFYGPLFALFLGTLASIWNSATHIPYIFDFSRIDRFKEVVYPTSINILYGGPAQKLGVWNTSNYVDTFAEYVISLIMLWTVIVLPWWLLRIFRDYCCEGIAAMKNILLSMYDSSRTTPGGPGPIGPVPTPKPTGTTGRAMQIPKAKDQIIKQKIEREESITREIKLKNVEDIRKAQTTEIVRSVSMEASKLTDIAQFETNKVHTETVKNHIQNLQNPMRAKTPTERSKYITMRNEIMDRATKGDRIAQRVLAVVSRSKVQAQVEKSKLLKSIPKLVPVIRTISIKFKLPEEKTRAVVRGILMAISQDMAVVSSISQRIQIPEAKTTEVIRALSKEENVERPAQEAVANTAKETQVEEEKVKQIVSQTAVVVRKKKELIEKVAQEQDVDAETVEKVAQSQLPAISDPASHIEDQVPVSPKVSIEEYEQVKNMWIDQYERGEVPVSNTIKNRAEWLKQDTVLITNILNKVSSSDPKMQMEGLDEVGEILPIFMVNSMSGEELVVYLKAKLEAAKQVRKQIEHEERAKQHAEEEVEFVEAPRAREKRAEKTMKMKLEQKIPENIDDKDTESPQEQIKKRLGENI